LQHAGNANRREIKVRKARQKLSQQKDDCGSIEDFEEERATSIATFYSLSKRERNGDPNDKEEKREISDRGRPSMPLGVLERPVDVRPRAGIVNQHHAGNGQAAETSREIKRVDWSGIRRSTDFADCHLWKRQVDPCNYEQVVPTKKKNGLIPRTMFSQQISLYHLR
jgi:hypothetical protein